MVYEDHVTALSDVTVLVERGVPAGIESDEITGGIRVVSGQDGSTVYDWQKPGPLAPLSGSWVNVDGRLGVVMVAGSGMTYMQTHGYLPGISVGADVLYGSYSDHPRQFKAGEEVARRVVLFFVEVGSQETSALAQSCRMEEKSSGQILRFKQPGGKLAEVKLASRG